MIYPICVYGSPVLRKKTEAVKPDDPNLKTIISNMFETMYNASGVGLAAPQVGLSLRLFIVDGNPMDESEEDGENMKGFKKVFINPEMISESGEEWGFEEGCLSIPNIRDEVWREETIQIKYYDEDFKLHTETFEGLKARIIQHEYDHIEGVLFTDHITGVKKQLMRRKLLKIAKGEGSAKYPIKLQKK